MNLKRSILRFSAVAGLVGALAVLLCPPVPADDWTLPRYDARLTNATTENLVLPLGLAWEHQTRAFPSNPSQPVAVGDMVVFSSGDRIIAADRLTGAQRWVYPGEAPLGSQIKTSLAAYNGSIYFGANDGNVYCLSATDGRFLWAYATQAPIRSSPMITNGVLYIGSDDNAMHAIDAVTGQPIWTGGFRTRDDITSVAAVDTGLVYFISRDTYMYVANAQTGRLRWRMRFSTPSLTIVPVVGQDTVYIGAGSLLMALGSKSGSRRWAVSMPAEISAPPALADNVLYVVTRNKRLYAIGTNGKAKWASPADTVYSARCSPTVAGDTVIVGADKGVVSAFDVATGILKWRYVIASSQSGDVKLSSNNNIVASPVWANGALYVLPDDGTLRAFRPDAPDSTPPEALNLLPMPGTSVSGSPPLRMSALLRDTGSGVDETTISFTLDGEAVEHVYDAAAGTVSYATPYSETQKPLRDGRHQLVLTATDWKGNTLTENWSFVVDNTLPKPKVRPAQPREPRNSRLNQQPQDQRRDQYRRDSDRPENNMPPPPPPSPGGPGGDVSF